MVVNQFGDCGCMSGLTHVHDQLCSHFVRDLHEVLLSWGILEVDILLVI